MVTVDDLKRIKRILIKDRDEGDNANEIIKSLNEWQPHIFAWLKASIEADPSLDNAVDCLLIVLVSLFEKETNSNAEHL